MTKSLCLITTGKLAERNFEERDHLLCVIKKELTNVGKKGILVYFSSERGHQSLIFAYVSYVNISLVYVVSVL